MNFLYVRLLVKEWNTEWALWCFWCFLFYK